MTTEERKQTVDARRGTNADNRGLLSLFYVRMVGKISLATGLVAVLGSALLVIYIARNADTSGDYVGILVSLGTVQQQLPAVLTFIFLTVVAVVAVITWAITLYSSFRIAGPIYRFGANLETAIKSGPITMIPIRETDSLQEESRQLGQCSMSLRDYYRELRQRSEALATTLTEDNRDRRSDALQQLVEVERRAQL